MKNLSLHSMTIEFIKQLRPLFQGDIDLSDAGKQIFSTDNSIYQLKPEAVVFPKNIEDLQLIMQVSNLDQFREIIITARGGGTGTNGQSLTNGIVVDLSRHMNNIIHIDPIKQIAVVQAGVVKDQLNLELKKYGLFFAPELSTSNRATIGGMINTDASGQGSCRYGKTHHHVLELKTILINGELLESAPLKIDEFSSKIQDKTTFQKNLYLKLLDMTLENKEIINKSFPKLNRSLTGYDLPALYDNEIFNINNVLCGSEGTLGFIAEATLNVLPIPKYQALINIGYDNFQNALKDAKALMALNPLSIETVDSKVLNLAKNDIVWQKVSKYFPEPEYPLEIQGINLVELDADTPDELEVLKQDFINHLQNDQSVKRLTITFANGDEEIKDVYAMRKRSVGLLGNVVGEKRPQPFVEDTAVPPENLADYIAEFRSLLDGLGLTYGMFGHVDAGVLHVRPLLDMKEAHSAELIKLISDKIVELTHKYGGVIWGEHGKGLRSEYAPIFFGESYPLIQKVKGLFDPLNKLNPGKIATPDTKPQANLIKLLDIPLRGNFDKQIAKEEWNAFSTTMHCNGNGACFNFDVNDPMCPSYKVTRDRIHSPKGRATLIKEWLRRENKGEKSSSFDKEVYDALHGCLSCKSCAGQCPIKVDIPDSKARFLEKFHQRYKRSLRDYLISNLERFMPIMSTFASLYNFIQKLSIVKTIQKNIVKVVDIPLFHPQASTDLEQFGAVLLKSNLSNLPKSSENSVIFVQDAFTRYFDTPVFLAAIEFVHSLGIKPYILPYFPNGKPLHVHGFIKEFERLRNESSILLNKAAMSGIPLVGIDPAMTLVYRQEYKMKYTKPVPDQSFEILLLQEWLVTWFNTNPLSKNISSIKKTYYLAGHCTERTQAPSSSSHWKYIFNKFGLQLEILSLGCCGMAGTYGHEAEHKQLSAKIYSQSWKHKQQVIGDQFIATGYSCRSQVKRLEHQNIRHPIQVLNEIFKLNRK
ncbi:FAD-binding and (Fe-S)-binding domain-containing protein [Acinetobacter baumannii]|uniref:FAD-binding and (Fe-S)-binding domain-containing protein n=1 Tax=Acinetobacter baumannii TaxID=470 RepID=UPI0029661265|nr:FAD-binding and (Fe-S)-binding domain-containing protein [Acinetobacter baumannii]MDW3025768.1 FAD-binding and (Fe-S)-binding domain-containing protein [Acinetobacter baumannii]